MWSSAMAVGFQVMVQPTRARFVRLSAAVSMKTCTSWQVLEKEAGRLELSTPVYAESMAVATKDMPQGAYTSLRTYGKCSFLLLGNHFDRLEETAALMDHPVKLRRDEYKRLLVDIARNEPSPESLLRITIGCTDRIGETWISAQPLKTPSKDDYRDGVYILTRKMHRDNPKAKDNGFIERSTSERQLIAGRVNEVVMISDKDEALEGLSSNFFGIKNGKIYTAEEGVLPGLTRSLILEAAQKIDIPTILEGPLFGDLYNLDEAFISSTSRGVLPVVRIDDKDIGIGKPGSLTLKVAAAYNALVEDLLEHP